MVIAYQKQIHFKIRRVSIFKVTAEILFGSRSIACMFMLPILPAVVAEVAPTPEKRKKNGVSN